MAVAYPVYIVDDEPTFRSWLGSVCEEQGWHCREFESGGAFLDAVGGLSPGCILLDMRMPGRDGIAVLTELSKRKISYPVIAMTGYAEIEVAVAAMKLGALEFLEKPFTVELLLQALNGGFEQLRSGGPAAG